MNAHTVLIADDDADIVALLSRHCRRLGLGVDTASDAMAALRKIDQLRPNVAILDVDMPGGNGLCVREMMANNEQLKSIPVIMLTGKEDEQTIRRCHENCTYYVTKCPDVWPRIEPVLRDLLDLAEPEAATPEPAVEQPRAEDRPLEKPLDEFSALDHMFELLANVDAEGDDSATNILSADMPPWVLCIDDDSELSFALQLRLQEHGAQVLRAFEGMEGYRTAFVSNPQVIICDYEMPQGRGDYVLRRLKESPATRDIPVIVLTGHTGHALERKMYNLGAHSFLNKPCSWETLWPILKPLLEVPVTV